MTSFRDRALLRLADPATLRGLLLPAADPGRAALRTVLSTAFDLAAVRIDQVTDVAVDELEPQRPLFPAARITGNWSQTVPGYSRTELDVTEARPAAPVWIDMLARLRVTVVVDIDPAGAESVVTAPVEPTSLDDFRTRFPFLDLDAFMREHGITTLAELRERFDLLVTTIQLKAAAPFDPKDPANVRTLSVPLAVLAVDPFDLAAGLRAARLVRETARTLPGAGPATIPAETASPYALAAVLAQSGLAGGGPSAADVQRLYASAGVAALFLDDTA
ncbi:hypothetical protein [Actinomadura rupiterrae]|uniref:hypothetical protein n=1 Tax=Actinomadura rupiterrae TaxID=559627 RepID=UPI0020A351D4|nr:hypothetical protein [Actinomadura rupiterrae]MCP2341344.1 hypothetical protein [Actinomadura rupiterrae]